MLRKHIIESLWDNNLRIDSIIWLAANACNLCDDLEQFLEYDPDEAEKLLGREVPVSPEDFEEYLTDLSREGKNGYLVKAAIPVYTGCGGSTISFTWGHCFVRWFYFEEWDEAQVHNHLLAWEQTTRKAAIAKAKNKRTARQP